MKELGSGKLSYKLFDMVRYKIGYRFLDKMASAVSWGSLAYECFFRTMLHPLMTPGYFNAILDISPEVPDVSLAPLKGVKVKGNSSSRPEELASLLHLPAVSNTVTLNSQGKKWTVDMHHPLGGCFKDFTDKSKCHTQGCTQIRTGCR